MSMASVSSPPFVAETRADCSLFLLLQRKNQQKHRPFSSFATFRTRKPPVLAVFGKSVKGLSQFCNGNVVGGRKWRVKNVKAVDSGSSGGDGGGSGDEMEDTLQATIEKSKKVLAMQKDLLQQIAERRKLVSSIKNSIADIDKDEVSYKDRNFSFENTGTDVVDGEIDGDQNGSIHLSGSAGSIVNNEQEVKPSTASIVSGESAKKQEQSLSPVKLSSSVASPSGVNNKQGVQPSTMSIVSDKSVKKREQSLSPVIPSSSVASPSTASVVNDGSVKEHGQSLTPKKTSSILASSSTRSVVNDGSVKEHEQSITPEKPSSSVASPRELEKPTSGAVRSKLPSYLTSKPEISNVTDEAQEESREATTEEVSGETNEMEVEGAKPPPLAGVNVMNVILVAAECAPWSKTGGLGDVAGSLPKALARRGHRVMVVAPRYGEYAEAQDTGVRKHYKVDGQDMEVTYFQAYIDGVDFVFINRPVFHHLGNNIYGGNRLDILKRMVLFCKAAVEVPWHVPCGGICYGDGNLVFIANDWHTALLPVYLKAYYRDHGLMKYTRSVIVIHNIAHQGRGPADDFFHMDLPEHYLDLFKLYDPVGGEHSNIFAAGLKAADRVVTVSHGYAWELKTSQGGWGLHNIINENGWKLQGIVNGIDTKEWNPKFDFHLRSDGYTNYSLETLSAGKPQCKAALQKELGLPIRGDVPVIGFIGRLDHQKGVDLIAEAVPWMMDQDVQLIMLGSGRPDLEQMLRQFENQHRDKVRGWVGFSVKTAHRITAGADILLMPSRFEPCGLNQLYAMNYGTIPVVHAVGGLRDTVEPFNPFNESGLGWTFDGAETSKLIHALGNCLLTYREYKKSWEGLQRRGMMQDLSWDHAAQKYEEVLIAAKYQW